MTDETLTERMRELQERVNAGEEVPAGEIEEVTVEVVQMAQALIDAFQPVAQAFVDWTVAANNALVEWWAGIPEEVKVAILAAIENDKHILNPELEEAIERDVPFDSHGGMFEPVEIGGIRFVKTKGLK